MKAFALVVVVCTLLCAVVRAETDCDASADSDRCKAAEMMRDLTVHSRGIHMAQVEEYATIMKDFESASNEWACAVSGFYLYEVPQEAMTFEFVSKILASAMKAKGQLYAAAIIKYYIKNVNTDAYKLANPYSCEGIAPRDPTKFNIPTKALLALKEAVTTWMLRHDAQPQEVVQFFVTQSRGLYGKWAMSRLSTISKKLAIPDDLKPIDQAIALAVLPLIDVDRNKDGKCSAGGELHFLFDNRTGSERIQEKSDEFLNLCYAEGRVTKKPIGYAKVLQAVHRTSQAMELYDIAVQRGQICNPHQRPDNHHRKELTAQPVWGIDAFPSAVRKAILEVQDPLRKAVLGANFPFSNDPESFGMFSEDNWERTLLWGVHGGNETLCRRMGDSLCRAIENLADVVTEANDAYSFTCNESLVMNLWRVEPGASTNLGNAGTNQFLQVVMPIVGKDTAVVAQVGDEIVKAREGDVMVIDDSFENRLTLVDESSDDPTLSDPKDLSLASDLEDKPKNEQYDFAGGSIIFQMQICHPELHPLAMAVPRKKCKGTPEAEKELLEEQEANDKADGGSQSAGGARGME